MSVYSYETSRGTRYGIQREHMGKRLHKQGFTSYKAADAFERRWIRNVERGLAGGDKDYTVEEVAAWWVEGKDDLKPSTLASYRGILAQFVDAYGDRYIREIEPLDIQAFIAGKTPKTAINYLTVLRTLFKDAVAYRAIVENPAEQVRRPRYSREPMRYLSQEEVARLLGVLRGRGKLLVEMAVYTGLRRGELFGLRWGDINGGYVEVKRSMYRGKPITPKSRHAYRKVPLVGGLREVVEASRGRDGAYVFPFDPDNFIKRDFATALKAAKLEGLRFHDLRHTFAALMISLNANPKYLQTVMGHESFKTTMDLYGGLYPSEHEGIFELLRPHIPPT